MDSTERTKRFNLLREGIEDENNKMILNSAVSSLYCKLSTVTQEVFFDIFSAIKDKNYLNNKANYDENEHEDEEDEDEDEEELLTHEEYMLIVNKLFDMVKEELAIVKT